MKGSALSSSRKIWISCMKALMYLCSGLTGALVLFLMGYVLSPTSAGSFFPPPRAICPIASAFCRI